MERCHMTLACWSVGAAGAVSAVPREGNATGESPCSRVRKGESLNGGR
jgi:hypothetical protein